MWLYVWIILLKPYLPNKIILHLSKFTFGCMLLMQTVVQNREISRANALLISFAGNGSIKIKGHDAKKL